MMAVTRTATVVVNLTNRGHFHLTCLFPHLSYRSSDLARFVCIFSALFPNLPALPRILQYSSSSSSSSSSHFKLVFVLTFFLDKFNLIGCLVKSE